VWEGGEGKRGEGKEGREGGATKCTGTGAGNGAKHVQRLRAVTACLEITIRKEHERPRAVLCCSGL